MYKIKEAEIFMTPSTYWKYDNAHRILVGEPERRDHIQYEE